MAKVLINNNNEEVDILVIKSRDEDPDPVRSVDFGPPDPDPLIFGPPDPDPTCDNGFIKLFSF